jgi:hypothetical protein
MKSRSPFYWVKQRPLGLQTQPVSPASETLAGHNGKISPTHSDWQLATVSALCDAEEMLDHLECQGYKERELLILGNSCFAVRWR